MTMITWVVVEFGNGILMTCNGMVQHQVGHIELGVGHQMLSGKTRKERAYRFSVLLRVPLHLGVKGKVFS